MTSCEARSPAGRRSCRNYVKRCLVVMLCCVLVFTMVPPPKAEATAGAATATLVASGAVAAAPVAATVGVLCLAALGISFTQGFIQNDDSIFYGSRSYEVGLKLNEYLKSADIPGSVATWWDGIVTSFEEMGGVLSGKTFTIPAESAELIRQWVTQTYDFSSGDITVSQSGIVCGDQMISFTQFIDPVYGSWCNFSSLGTIPVPSDTQPISYIFTDALGATWEYLFSISYFAGDWSYKLQVFKGTVEVSPIGCSKDNFFVFSAIPQKNAPSYEQGHLYLVPSTFNTASGTVLYSTGYQDSAVSQKYMRIDNLMQTISSTISGSDVLDVPVVEDVAVKVPALPTDKVGEMEIPIVGELDYTDVLTGEIDKPIDPPIEGEGTMVGDVALEDIAGMEGELGALFISKFPFSIPWDLFRAVKLLAAPPEAPYWEVDFLAPMEHRVGSWKGDTTVVIDMSEYEIVGIVCRWTSTLLFCAALIAATKRLIWTA